MPGVKWLERLMNTVADRGRELLGLREDESRDGLPDLCRRLIAGRGEASNIALAREILQRFEMLDEQDKTGFLITLAEEFGPDAGRISDAVAAFRNDQPATLVRLLEAVEPPRQELFRRLNMAPLGTASLVAMRAQLLDRLGDHPLLSAVDADLRHLLASWFNRGFLRLQRLDWHSPAVVLERLMRYESVHPIQGWDDLRRRLGVDRRCFGFFHPALPDEPLIFVEVALTRTISAEIAPLIDPQAPTSDPDAADTAMFYSINNALRGLRGISFGNFLLKQVLSDLATELPQLRHFATLSPMPRFAAGLQRLLNGEIEDWPTERLDAVLADHQAALAQHGGEASPCAALRQLLSAPATRDEPLLAEPLARLALVYLSELKQPGGGCLDPVAAFHLANGATLERINAFADRTLKGEAQSHGMMVNYRYDPDQVVANHEAFVRAGRIVMSRALQREYDKHIAGKH
ncbi:MAG: malonyl-CoA decarboxylase [Chromatiaceae bacterium]|jgi:malonyl-CoA decarboxylase|nr:malonyl-CoA decarboxylase [Chromatiaceae bacterium]